MCLQHIRSEFAFVSVAGVCVCMCFADSSA